MSLAAVLRRPPAEIEQIGFHDAITLLQTIRRDERHEAEFQAALNDKKLQ